MLSTCLYTSWILSSKWSIVQYPSADDLNIEMANLPAEIIHLICGYIPQRPRRFVFSRYRTLGEVTCPLFRMTRLACLVSRRFAPWPLSIMPFMTSLSRPYVNMQRSNFFDYASLELAVDKISAEHYRHHMRRLDIMTLPNTWRQILFDEKEIEPWQTPELGKFISINDFIPDAAKADYTQELLSSWSLPNLDEGQMRLSYHEEKNWEPLAKLIKTVRRLETLNYAAANNYPRSLLEVIHQYHPTCQLNIWSNQNIALDLPGLGNVMDSIHPQFSDPVDINLFRSPCLRAISLWYATWDDDEDPNHAE